MDDDAPLESVVGQGSYRRFSENCAQILWVDFYFFSTKMNSYSRSETSSLCRCVQ